MTGIPFIIDLFKAVLNQSKAIQGRFVAVYRNGAELNSDELGQVIEQEVSEAKFQKYPVALMFPPRSSANSMPDRTGNGFSWIDWNITMFFLQTSYSDSINQVRDRNKVTGTSKHSVPMDWHDMQRAALYFVHMLKLIQMEKATVNDLFRVSSEKAFINPVSLIGKDKASGVQIDFKISTGFGCYMEDYGNLIEVFSNIEIPASDSHPEHFL